jgi:hypothetical protein
LEEIDLFEVRQQVKERGAFGAGSSARIPAKGRRHFTIRVMTEVGRNSELMEIILAFRLVGRFRHLLDGRQKNRRTLCRRRTPRVRQMEVTGEPAAVNKQTK